jgi:hypothetical protein
MSRNGSFLRAIGFAALVLVTAIFVRERWDSRVEIPGEARWVAMDSDTLYHVRRLSRLMEEGFPVAERDPYLDYPEGSAIPWPPYYSVALWAVLAPLAPAEPEARRVWIEEGVASLPMVFGAATSLLALVAAWMLAGPTAGLFAGLYHAVTLGSITYSRAGNGDHHAWISFLDSAMFLVAAIAFRRGALERARSAVPWGVAAGVLAGVLLGSWVASLLYVALFQLVLGLVLVWNAARPRPASPLSGSARGSSSRSPPSSESVEGRASLDGREPLVVPLLAPPARSARVRAALLLAQRHARVPLLSLARRGGTRRARPRLCRARRRSGRGDSRGFRVGERAGPVHGAGRRVVSTRGRGHRIPDVSSVTSATATLLPFAWSPRRSMAARDRRSRSGSVAGLSCRRCCSAASRTLACRCVPRLGRLGCL